MSEKGSAKRFNEGKVRLDLVPTSLVTEVGKVLTFGANKYGDNNWRNLMCWSKCIASLERHLVAFKNGIDFDEESGLLHLSHLACNVAFLLEYYKINPQGDDRVSTFRIPKKVGLDVDEVIADFMGAIMKKFPEKIKERSIYWNDPILKECFEQIVDNEEFWLGIEPLTNDLPFEPHCYITSRSISKEITQKWLDKNGFPKAPLYTLKAGESKVEAAKQSGCDIFVDDNYNYFLDLNRNGICCYLFDAPHNRRYDVGYKRIKSLSELTDYNEIKNNNYTI